MPVDDHEVAWKSRRSVRLAELRTMLKHGDGPHPLETMVTIRRIEAAVERERELAAMLEVGR
jgi:hypothetical protein